MSEIVKPSNNLFSHCPKELVLDGFLAWLFNYLNESKNETAKLKLVESLFSGKGKTFEEVSNIKTERQKESVDLLVHFNSKGVSHTVLFENKTWSGPHDKQLQRYRRIFPDCLKYIYLKLAFIPYSEMVEAEKHGYVVITSNQLLEAIEPLKTEHLFIEEFCDYLSNNFVLPQQSLGVELFERNNFRKLQSSQAQQFILSELHENLARRENQCLNFSASSSYGQAFTLLTIAIKTNTYGNLSEKIYWRIDKRSKRYCIKLIQYSKVSIEHAMDKKLRLMKLRDLCKEILLNPELNWHCGKLSDQGLQECEMAIFFFDEDKNSLSKIRTGLEKFSLAFIEKYSEFNQPS